MSKDRVGGCLRTVFSNRGLYALKREQGKGGQRKESFASDERGEARTKSNGGFYLPGPWREGRKEVGDQEVKESRGTVTLIKQEKKI